jgi:hypothetical protein
VYRKNVVVVTLATGVTYLLFICMHFWVWVILRRRSARAPTAYEVVRDCRKFYKHWYRESIQVAKINNKLITNCGARTQRFISAFTTARHRSVSWASRIQSTPLPANLKYCDSYVISTSAVPSKRRSVYYLYLQKLQVGGTTPHSISSSDKTLSRVLDIVSEIMASKKFRKELTRLLSLHHLTSQIVYEGMTLNESTEFCKEWINICHNLSSKFRTIAKTKSYVKQKQ